MSLGLDDCYPTPEMLARKEKERASGPIYRMPEKGVVATTARDAASVKLGAVSRGYYIDNYLRLLTESEESTTNLTLRAGYALRVRCFDILTRAWIQHYGGRCSVCVLGVGADSLYFRLAADGVRAQCWIETDLMQNVADRAAAILRHPELMSLLPPDAQEAMSTLGARSATYTLRACDLSSTPYVERLSESIPADLPLLILAECVFVYLHPENIRSILRVLRERVTGPAALVVNEQSGVMDMYMHKMVADLTARGLSLPGLESAQTEEQHCQRYAEFFPAISQRTMEQEYQAMDTETRARWDALEPEADDDDRADFLLMGRHYSLTIGADSEETRRVLADAL